jgi:hypothetical protein
MTVRRRSHVSDDRLVAVATDGPSASEQAHFDACAVCAARRARLESLLLEVVNTAAAETDALFTTDRLTTQRARILQRVGIDGRPARVIAFPRHGTSDSRLFRTRPSSRWVAAAAAAGLAVGLVVGRMSLPERPRARRQLSVSARFEPPSPMVPATLRVSDEEFLGQIENAVRGPAEVLRPLNELTPVVEQFASLDR